MVWASDTHATISEKSNCIAAIVPSDHTSPSTVARISAVVASKSSAVTMQGPREFAKSLPIAGPRLTDCSRRWMSRALQSLKIV